LGEEPGVRRRHLEYYRSLAEQAEPHFYGPDQLDWMNRLTAERDNVRAAIEWSRRENVSDGLRTASALIEFWFNRDLFTAGATQLLEILSEPAAAQPTLERAKALTGAGTLLAWTLGDHEAAGPLLQEALTIVRQRRDPLIEARANLAMGVVALGRNQPDVAMEHLNECCGLLLKLGRPEFLGDAHHHLGNAALRAGDFVRAGMEFDAAYGYYAEAGHRNKVAGIQRHRANISLRLARIGTARSLARESLAMNIELQSQTGVLSCIVTLAGIAIANGDAQVAARLLGAVDGLVDALRTHLYYADQF
jgi:non-specific serine/threonine protein kinase